MAVARRLRAATTPSGGTPDTAAHLGGDRKPCDHPRSSSQLVALGGAMHWRPLSTAANGEPFGAIFEESAIAEIIASPVLRDELSVRTRLCQLAMY